MRLLLKSQHIIKDSTNHPRIKCNHRKHPKIPWVVIIFLMFEQTERHFFLVLGFQRIRHLSYHATQGFNLLLVSIMVDVPSSLRMLKGPSSYFTFIPVWLVYVLCNWLFADEKRMRKTQDSHFPSHPRHSTATDPGVFLQRHPRQKRVWSWWSMGHLNRFPISGQPKWTISKHKRLDGGVYSCPKICWENCSQISLVERSPTFFLVFNNNTFETTNIPSPVFPQKWQVFLQKSGSFATDIAPKAPSPQAPRSVEWDSRCTRRRCSAGAHAGGRWGPARRP